MLHDLIGFKIKLVIRVQKFWPSGSSDSAQKICCLIAQSQLNKWFPSLQSKASQNILGSPCFVKALVLPRSSQTLAPRLHNKSHQPHRTLLKSLHLWRPLQHIPMVASIDCSEGTKSHWGHHNTEWCSLSWRMWSLIQSQWLNSTFCWAQQSHRIQVQSFRPFILSLILRQCPVCMCFCCI